MEYIGPDFYNISDLLTEEELLIQKTTGYVSYVKGEDPFSFPYRVYPFDFDDINSSKNDNFNANFSLSSE